MKNLDYRGTKSTRLQLAAFTMLVATGYLIHSYTQQPFDVWLNFFDQWLSVSKWTVGIYGTTEVLAKASEAYRDRS